MRIFIKNIIWLFKNDLSAKRKYERKQKNIELTSTSTIKGSDLLLMVNRNNKNDNNKNEAVY